jgi:hypothetical protein
MLGYAGPAPLQIVLPDPTLSQLSRIAARKRDAPIPGGSSSISAPSLLVRRVPANHPTASRQLPFRRRPMRHKSC